MAKLPRYKLQESFYDNLVLWDAGEEIDFDGEPCPNWIPLNEEAHAALTAYHDKKREFHAKKAELAAKRGEDYPEYEGYVPPLSELPDTLDGQVTVAAFEVGQRRSNPKKTVIPPFPVTPGKHGTKMAIRGASSPMDATNIAAENIAAVVSGKTEIQPKAAKNFDRAPR